MDTRIEQCKMPLIYKMIQCGDKISIVCRHDVRIAFFSAVQR